MTFLSRLTAFSRPFAPPTRRQPALTPDEQAELETRRRLMRFIIETHRRREAERGLSHGSTGRSA
ncbi:MAG: hypothetical protein AAF266_11065 [Planctomycetota bacterium]